ncbi:MAG: hypothetical protein IJU23_11195 [Proteobacteria bacterium]|nr:hypothetical protein [Pseudomonadota bacterium]
MANNFENETFLFTGKLKNMKREEAEAKVVTDAYILIKYNAKKKQWEVIQYMDV